MEGRGWSVFLVSIVGDKERLVGLRSRSTTLVVTSGGLSVGLGTEEVLLLGGSDVLVQSLPGVEAGLLEGTSKREREVPGARSSLLEVDVHGVEVNAGLLLTESTRQELIFFFPAHTRSKRGPKEKR